MRKNVLYIFQMKYLTGRTIKHSLQIVALTTIKFMQNASRSAGRPECEQLASNLRPPKKIFQRHTGADVALAR